MSDLKKYRVERVDRKEISDFIEKTIIQEA